MVAAHPVRPAIVVGIDRSLSALHATRWAAKEAELRRVPLRVVHAYVPPAVHHPTTRNGQAEYLGALRDGGRHWVREAVAAARKVAPAVEVTDVVRVGGAADGLIAESVGSLLTVLGSGGLGDLPEVPAASIAIAVAEHGHSPVVVVRGANPEDPPPATGPVVVGVDGSPASEAAVAFAFDTASFRRADLVAVHCWSPMTFDGSWRVNPLAMDEKSVAEEERELLDERMAGWQEKYPDVVVRRIVVRDQPVRALLRAAEHFAAALVVVGTRGLGDAVTGMGLGSTSHALLRYGACPVAVVRPNMEGDHR